MRERLGRGRCDRLNSLVSATDPRRPFKLVDDGGVEKLTEVMTVIIRGRAERFGCYSNGLQVLT
jgi:hypothetical protein